MAERIVSLGTHRFTKVICTDEPGADGACYLYLIESVEKENVPTAIFGLVQFQNGPVKENGVNGLHQEDLLAIVVDRLQHFQKGPFSCRENAKGQEMIERLRVTEAERDEAKRGAQAACEALKVEQKIADRAVYTESLRADKAEAKNKRLTTLIVEAIELVEATG